MQDALKEFVKRVYDFVELVHKTIGRINTKLPYSVSDKALHFLVVGLCGLIMFAVLYPIFKKLAEKKKTHVITAIYVTTSIAAVSVAAEIGQGLTGTGTPELRDVIWGIIGFIFFYVLVLLIMRIKYRKKR